MGERKARRGWLRVRFALRIAETGSRRFDLEPASERRRPEIVVDIRAEPAKRIAERHADAAMALYGRGVLVAAIAEKLGIERHQAAEAVRLGHLRRGLPAPADGRVRRGTVSDKSLKAPVFREIADEAKRLLDENLLVEEIAGRLGRNRDTVRAALRHWHESGGEPMPDLRHRRKARALKNRTK